MAAPRVLRPRATQVLRALDTTVEIETPEHVLFSCSLAGPARRALAYLIDLFVRAAILIAIGIALSLASLAQPEISGWKLGALLLLMFALEWGYFVACESFMNGRSVGKRALGLRVVTQGGLPVSFGASVLRNLLRAADFLPTGYAVGLLTMTLDPRFRRLGDWAADTMVIIEERPRLREPIRLHPPPTAAELDQLPTRLDLPGPVLEALELFLRRAPELQTLREDELASMLATIYGQRLNLRYQNASRFLGLLYVRAVGGKPSVR
ncbi:MAG TPA: RDD family protein [Polyangiaceae bacterium]|nr:RDD family protein [Polyangiaceae bacterium]HYQ31062.1 RDD family protein [Polyangiaceae bacterium]